MKKSGVVVPFGAYPMVRFETQSEVYKYMKIIHSSYWEKMREDDRKIGSDRFAVPERNWIEEMRD